MSDAPRDPPITTSDLPIRLAVCVSGGGTTLANLLEKIAAGLLRAEVVRVVASKAGIGAIARAEGAANIPVSLVTSAGALIESLEDFSAAVFEPILPGSGRPGRARRLPRTRRDPARLRSDGSSTSIRR